MRLIIPLVLLVSACTGEAVVKAPAPQEPQAAETLPPADDDCTLATPLVPGIPGSPGNLIKSPRNPNGDSELSALMRDFVDDLREARTLLEAKEPVKKLYPTHRNMRCAWPTKPEERNEKYDGLAQSYLAVVKAYDKSPGQDTYNGIIAGCIACHGQSCGGPIPFIESMRWQ